MYTYLAPEKPEKYLYTPVKKCMIEIDFKAKDAAFHVAEDCDCIVAPSELLRNDGSANVTISLHLVE